MSHALIGITGKILLFSLIFGMSATVDVTAMKNQLKNGRAILTGIVLQFILMPFLGWLVVKSFELDYVTGLTLLVVTSSPGGSYSNWWCSIFNADLALSVTMTAVSTLLSIVMLPLNLYIYANLIYQDDIIEILEWDSLLVSLAVVIAAVGLGLTASHNFDSVEFNLNANRLGNFAGIALVIFSTIMSNSSPEYQIWDYDWSFYFAVALPCILGLVIANVFTTSLWLVQPERVTVSIECCYQNIGIATALCVSMFDDNDQLSEALGVPFFYGIVEAVILALYCIWAWQMGWTKAPTDVTIFKAMATSYEVKTRDSIHHSSNPDKDNNDKTKRLTELPTTTKVSREKPSPEGRRLKTTQGGKHDDDLDAWNYVDYADLPESMHDVEVQNDPTRIQRAKKELLKQSHEDSKTLA